MNTNLGTTLSPFCVMGAYSPLMTSFVDILDPNPTFVTIIVDLLFYFARGKPLFKYLLPNYEGKF